MIIELLIGWITQLIGALGYPGIFLLMLLESTAAPVPSEAVLPFAGFLVAQGRFGLWLVVAASILGSIAGSLASYYIGALGGRPLIRKAGRWLLLHEQHLEQTENFFRRHGAATIFIARFIPVVRHLISIPAGIARMNLKTFILLTLAGATIWNAFLVLVGMWLMENWSAMLQYTELIDYAVVCMIVFGFVWWILSIRKKS